MKKEQFLYQRVYTELKEKILKGELKEGQCLPVAAELAKEYHVSSITINHALDALKKEGYVNRIKGKGSFAMLPKEDSTEIAENLSHGSMSIVKKRKMLGLVLEHVSSCFGLDIMYALDVLAAEAGYHLQIRFSYGKRAKETEEIEYLRELGVDGLIVMPCHGPYYNTEILKLIVDGFPAVLIDKTLEGIPISSVRTDNRLAMKQLVDYLVKKGRRRIGFITILGNETSSVRERREGFFSAIEDAGLSHMPECCLEESGELEIYSDDFNFIHRESMEAYLEENKDLDAVVCAEYGVTRCLDNSKDRRQIEICCVDEDYLSPGGPYFTHIRQNERGIAAEAMAVLLQQIDKDESYHQTDKLVEGLFREVKH